MAETIPYCSKNMSTSSGTLYIVATPIGNLEDFSPRAQRVLAEVDLIAAEDTRHSKKLAAHFGINTPMQACHDHNEKDISGRLIDQLQQGKHIALISDAGTPLISDPGYVLVRDAVAAGITVSPVPGPSAMIAALSVCGLPTDAFGFYGFLPAKSTARIKAFQALAEESKTLVFYESSHRIQACLSDMLIAFGEGRNMALCRELSKQFETVLHGTVAELVDVLAQDSNQSRGEFVLVVDGAKDTQDAGAAKTMLDTMLKHGVAGKVAAKVVSELTGVKKNELYKMTLEKD